MWWRKARQTKSKNVSGGEQSVGFNSKEAEWLLCHVRVSEPSELFPGSANILFIIQFLAFFVNIHLNIPSVADDQQMALTLSQNLQN